MSGKDKQKRQSGDQSTAPKLKNLDFQKVLKALWAGINLSSNSNLIRQKIRSRSRKKQRTTLPTVPMSLPKRKKVPMTSSTKSKSLRRDLSSAKA